MNMVHILFGRITMIAANATIDQLSPTNSITPTFWTGLATVILSFISLSGLGGIMFLTLSIRKTIAEKHPESLFGYYSKMLIHLNLITAALQKENNTPLYYLLADNVKGDIDSYTSEKFKRKLHKTVEEFLELLKNSEWQIPINNTFYKEFTLLFQNLMTIYEMDEYHDFESNERVESFYKEIKKRIEELSSIIKSEQETIIQKYKKE